MDYQIDLARAIGISAISLVVLLVSWAFLRTGLQKLFLTVGLVGTWVLCGFGAAYQETPPSYPVVYVVFLLVVSIAFIACLRITKGLQRRLEAEPSRTITAITQKPSHVNIILTAYFGFCLLPLLYPTVRIDRLWNPPRPDIDFAFNCGVSKGTSLVEKLVEYGTALTFPFFLTSLYYHRRHYVRLVVLLAIPHYLSLCSTEYFGRGTLVQICLFLFFLVWMDRPDRRAKLAACAAASAPLLLLALLILGTVRSGGDLSQADVASGNAIESLIHDQTSFPAVSGVVLEGNSRADLFDYALWLVTTPIPKVITGQLSNAEINHRIAEMITGVSVGSENFNVILTGAVTESVYIYGWYAFWVHALFIGAVFGILCRITESIPCALPIGVHYAVAWGYTLNRAGIASAWPPLCNEFLLFYILVFCLAGRDRRLPSRVRAIEQGTRLVSSSRSVYGR